MSGAGTADTRWRSAARAQVDDPARLADRALDLADRHDLDLRADPDQRLDVVPQRGGDALLAGGAVGRRLGPQLRHHLELVELVRPADLEQVMAGERRLLEDQLLDLTREEIDPADDQHVVAAAGHLLHAP